MNFDNRLTHSLLVAAIVLLCHIHFGPGWAATFGWLGTCAACGAWAYGLPHLKAWADRRASLNS